MTLATVRDITLHSGRTVTVHPTTDTPDVKGKKKDDDKWWLALLLVGLVDIRNADDYWKLYAPKSFRGLLGHANGFGWDEPTQRYTKNGEPYDPDEIRQVYLKFLGNAAKDIEKQASRMARGRIPLGEWQESQARAIKSLYIASEAVGLGGISFVNKITEATPAPIGDVVPVNLPGALNDAFTRLQRFGDSMGDIGTVTMIVHRAGLYASPAHGVFEYARKSSHEDAKDASGNVITWEQRNNLDDGAVHCRTTATSTGCPEVTDQGWQPLGVLPDVGHRSCKTSCRCWWSFRVAPPNKLTDAKAKDFKALAMSASRFINLAGGRTVEVLALSASTRANISKCPRCGSYDITRKPNIVAGRPIDRCRNCNHAWIGLPGTLTAAQHSPGQQAMNGLP